MSAAADVLPGRIRVLVVGAGPTGLTTALELVRRGVEVLLVDRRAQPLPWDRATVIHSRTLEIFDALGLVEEFLQRGHRMDGVNIFAYGQRCVTLRFDSIDSRYPFDLNLSEHITEQILARRLLDCGGAVHRGWTLTALSGPGSDGTEPDFGGPLTARLEASDGRVHSLEADWVVGCDGLRSSVRDLIGMAVEGHAYDTLWGVVDGRLEHWPHDPRFGAVQIEPPSLNPLPLGPDRWRVYFRADAELEGQPAALLPRIAAALTALAPGAALVDHDEPMLFRTYRQVSCSFRRGRVLLAGDAAHACSPIEGHGMNAGIQDAFNLAWKLALVLDGAADEDLIHTYEPERRPVVEAFGASGDAAEQLRAVPDQRPAVERVKRLLMAGMVSPQDRYQAALAESELDFRYGPSPIVRSHWQGSSGAGTGGDRSGGESQPSWLGPHPGDRLPDAGPLQGQPGVSRLYDLLRQPDFVLLWLATDATRVELAPEWLAALESLARVWFISTAGWEPLPSRRWLLDAEGLVHARLGVVDPTLLVVRPDSRVGFRCQAPDPLLALDYFRGWRHLPLAPTVA
ncbi:FAD-dependent oxidoreductase [Vulcanococcus limneticus Candia 3F8]|uniref:FAD-dependent oxidoreductase n=1 Tax=Vulcanococcus limneticus TaxID=2170428 RepID=UPI000D527065|nr:FAD-dependent oxidoreductase [Vulcanococcus limneticus]MCP9793399.1 FAD-dependent oxidoreductase [Vulcanococcus limneticus MW73D5]MCP9893133.1 FAD-dependent oxidoreductase [Vulcanococcus limneticus Candia 3F8]MCP9898758.1 FAD-dependent oxidoreductase [Vulcanococcus limneticus Candia 3B3]